MTIREKAVQRGRGLRPLSDLRDLENVRVLEAWVFDVYARDDQIVLWFLDRDGVPYRVTDEYHLEFYLSGKEQDVEPCIQELIDKGDAKFIGPTQRKDIWSDQLMDVSALQVSCIEDWKQKLSGYAQRYPEVSWYNADLLPTQVYLYERNIFPLALCTVAVNGDGVLCGLELNDNRWLSEYELPPMRKARLEAKGSIKNINRPELRLIRLEYEDRIYEWDDPREMLSGFQNTFNDLDPDVVLTKKGDGHVFPLLLAAARASRFPLCLDRADSPKDRKIELEGRSYHAYGQVKYKQPDYDLFGRWHLDEGNSFWVSHTGLDGLAESARVGGVPIQRGSRRSIGTGITAVQLAEAWRRKVLVPWKKTEPEAWKTGNTILKTDRGGLVYAPRCGFYENIVELDFASMYPSIMTNYNISPETINAPEGGTQRVPDIFYRVASRRGLVSQALEPLVSKRQELKKLRKQAQEKDDQEAYQSYNHRQDALKWMLVCCFGYLGYRNARFGRIEAHEAVSALSRELLTRAKEICINAGWSMLHANVDCVWIHKDQWDESEIDELIEEINVVTNLSIALEGIYKWIGFLPSRQTKNRPVPTRYFGAFRDGKLKYRGIEARRHDMPDFIRNVQIDFLNQLAETNSAQEYRELAKGLRPQMDEFEKMLWQNEVPLDELVLKTVLSQDPQDYKSNAPSALAARQAMKAGLTYHAGQAVHYILTNQGSRDVERRVRLYSLLDADTTYDPKAYVRIFRRAMNTLLWPAGEKLEEEKINPPWSEWKTKYPEKKKEQNEQLDFLAG